jgi:hypothetical protein
MINSSKNAKIIAKIPTKKDKIILFFKINFSDNSSNF